MHPLQYFASGDWLWAVLILGGVALGILSVKAPAIFRVFVANPIRWVWGKVKGAKLTERVTNTRTWKWLESKEYDPPGKPLSWWVSRGIAVVVLWAFTVIWAHERGRSFTLTEMPAAFIGSDALPKKIESAWKDRALSCEKSYEDALNREVNREKTVPVILTPVQPSLLEPSPPPVTLTEAPKTKIKRRPPAKNWWDF